MSLPLWLRMVEGRVAGTKGCVVVVVGVTNGEVVVDPNNRVGGVGSNVGEGDPNIVEGTNSGGGNMRSFNP